MNKPRKPSPDAVDEMLDAYITAALWSSNDESDESGGDPLDKNYGPGDVAAATKAKMRADVVKFLTENWRDIDGKYRRAGRDFWLTRNGHGAGFWDGDWPKGVEDRLTAASKRFGETNLFVFRGKVTDGMLTRPRRATEKTSSRRKG